MEIRAHRRNFQIALHTETWGKVAIDLPGPCKDKGFSGLGLDMRYFQVHQTSVCSIFQMGNIQMGSIFQMGKQKLPTPNKLFNTLGPVTLTGVILCLCCSNNSAKSSVSTQRQFLNENRKYLNGMYRCRYWHAQAQHHRAFSRMIWLPKGQNTVGITQEYECTLLKYLHQE